MKKDPSAANSQKISKRKKGVIKIRSDFARNARYGLSVQEYRLIYYAILVGQQDGKPFSPVDITVPEFKEIFEVSGNDYYKELRKHSKTLAGKVVEIVYKDDEGQHLKQATWVSDITYHARNSMVTITPNPALKPFFEGKPFTPSEMFFIIKFTSRYAERLYEILKSMPINKKPVIDFDVDDLAQRLVAPPSCRANYADFYKRVLAPALQDINEFTDLDVEIREKRGHRNKVNLVYFSVMQKKVPKLAKRIEQCEFGLPLSDEEQTIMIQRLLGEDISNAANPEEVPQLPGQVDFDGGIIGDE